MRRKTLIFIAVMLFSALAAFAQGSHEYAPIQEKEVSYKDWTYKNLKDGSDVNLRQFSQGKKLVLVVYFAPWCPNWKNEAPIAAKLYDKYKKDGLEVIGVSEYASRDDVRNYFGATGPPYTVVSESESREERDKTAHFGYRQKTGDTRKWGSPYNLFLVPAKLKPNGEILTEKTWIVNGELIEADVDKFIREQLGVSGA